MLLSGMSYSYLGKKTLDWAGCMEGWLHEMYRDHFQIIQHYIWLAWRILNVYIKGIFNFLYIWY